MSTYWKILLTVTILVFVQQLIAIVTYPWEEHRYWIYVVLTAFFSVTAVSFLESLHEKES